MMSWYQIAALIISIAGLLVVVGLAVNGFVTKLIEGLAQSMFKMLTDQIDNIKSTQDEFAKRFMRHEEKEESFQKNLTDLTSGMLQSLARLEVGQGLYVTVVAHAETVKRIDESIIEARHQLRNELQTAVLRIENTASDAHDKLHNDIEALRIRVSNLAERK